MEQCEDKSYRGVAKKKNNLTGRYSYRANVTVDGKTKYFGYYKTAKEAAKARDLYIIKNNIDLETVFLKKKLA